MLEPPTLTKMENLMEYLLLELARRCNWSRAVLRRKLQLEAPTVDERVTTEDTAAAVVDALLVHFDAGGTDQDLSDQVARLLKTDWPWDGDDPRTIYQRMVDVQRGDAPDGSVESAASHAAVSAALMGLLR